MTKTARGVSAAMEPSFSGPGGRGSADLAEQAGQQVRGDVDVLDRVELARQGLGGEAEQGARRHVAVDRDPRPLGLGPRALDHADALGLGAGLDPFRPGPSLRPVAGVLRLLGDQQALAPGEFGPGGEFVLGDGAFLLHGQRPSGEGRLVGLLLQCLVGRRLQRALQLARRGEIGEPHRDHGDADLSQRRLGGERRLQLPAQGFRPGIEQRTHRRLSQKLQHGLVGEPGDARLDPLDRLALEPAGAQVEEKSIRLASRSGSATCQPMLPWTATVWKSLLRPRTNSVISRSSIGSSLMLAVSGRNQKTRPRPL
ncbi:hypothetical protein GCM10025880_15350 [Methylorubrum aminovorans]|nr:hypothetical protein GCM10025880_15350 [Methylorubrum aminovorans]